MLKPAPTSSSILFSCMLGACLWGACLMLPAATQAGSPQTGSETTFEEAVEVRLVEVETWVTDRKGRPVYDLDADDFVLEVDGEERDIEHFESSRPGLVPDGATNEAADETGDGAEADLGADAATVRDPLFLAVYLDRRFLETKDLELARDDLDAFLRRSVRPGDQVLLAVADEELRVEVPFTEDHGAVSRRMAEFKGSSGAAKLAGEYLAILRDLRMEQSARATNENSAGSSADSTRVLRRAEPETYLSEIDAFHREAAGEMRIVAEQLLQLVATLTGLPGRKQVLYVGGPLPTGHAQTLFEAWRDAFERALDDTDFFRTNPNVVTRAANRATAESGNFRVGSELFRGVATAAAVADITVHTLGLTNQRRSRNAMASRVDVEVGSLGRGVAESPLIDTSTRLAMDDGMQVLAFMTGGRHLKGRKRLERFFDQVEHDLESRYMLGFSAEPDGVDQIGEPAGRQAGEAPRYVKVKLRDKTKQRRYVVRHRERFMVKPRHIELAERTQSALLMDKAASNELDVELELYAPEARVEDWVLNIAVRIPMRNITMIPDRGRHVGKLTLFATAGRLGGALASVMKAELPVHIADKDLELARTQKAEYVFTLRTPKDPGRVAVTVRDDLGPVESTVGLEVDVTPGSGKLIAGR